MSLINNMLKELEKRDKHIHPSPYLTSLQSKLNNKNKKLNQKLFLISISLLCFFFLALMTLMYPSSKSKIMPPLKNTINKTVFQQNSTHNSWLSPGLITGITLQVKDNITEITFLLSHPVLYRLNTNQMNNELSLIFYQTTLEAEIPPIEYLNTALYTINHKINYGDTQFNLRFYPHSTIKYINLNTENKSSELVIAIESPVSTEKIHSQAKTIKIPAMQTLLLQQYQSALNQIEKGAYQIGVQQLESLLKADPQYKDARTSLVAILLNQQHLTKANRFLDEGLEFAPDHIPFLELKARSLIMQNKAKDALNLLLTVRPPITENPDYYALIASLYERTNQDLMAIKKYKQLIYLDAQNGNWWLGLGFSLEKLGQHKSALTAYQKAEELGHLNTEAIQFLQNRLALLQGVSHETE